MDKGSWVLIATTAITVAGSIAVAVIDRSGDVGRPSKVEDGPRPSVPPSEPPTAASTVPAPSTTPTPAPSIDGVWRDQFGVDYTVTSVGDRVAMQAVAGSTVFRGTGTFVDSRLKVTVVSSLDASANTCDGTRVTATNIRSACVKADGGRFDWQLERLP